MASITNEDPPRRTLRALRIGLGLVLVAGLVLVVRWALGERLDPKAALGLLRSVQDLWWARPAFVVTYVGATAVFLPAVLFHMVSGAAWGFAAGLGLNFVAVNASASLQFLFARWLGRERLARWLPARHLKLFDGAAARHGFRAVVAIRMLPLPHMAVNVAAGVSAMRWREFALGSFIGTLPVLLIYTYFAASLVEGVAGVERRALVHTGIAGAIVLAATFLPKVLGWLRQRRSGARAAAPVE